MTPEQERHIRFLISRTRALHLQLTTSIHALVKAYSDQLDTVIELEYCLMNLLNQIKE